VAFFGLFELEGPSPFMDRGENDENIVLDLFAHILRTSFGGPTKGFIHLFDLCCSEFRGRLG
jgi:hypothetical protein